MNKKQIVCGLAAMFLAVACKKESAADKISDTAIEKIAVVEKKITDFPTAEFDKNEHDFGVINQGDKVETTFMIANNGKADLIIINATGSCGCTVPEYPKTPVKPGEKAPIKVTFDSAGKSGQQQKSVTLTTNTQKGYESISIKANITPKSGISTQN